MNPYTVIAASVLVALAASGVAGLAAWRWVARGRTIRRLRADLREERAATATYRLWLNRPVDELRARPANRPDPGE